MPLSSSEGIDLAMVGPLEVTMEQVLSASADGAVSALLGVTALKSTPANTWGLSPVDGNQIRQVAHNALPLSEHDRVCITAAPSFQDCLVKTVKRDWCHRTGALAMSMVLGCVFVHVAGDAERCCAGPSSQPSMLDRHSSAANETSQRAADRLGSNLGLMGALCQTVQTPAKAPAAGRLHSRKHPKQMQGW